MALFIAQKGASVRDTMCSPIRSSPMRRRRYFIFTIEFVLPISWWNKLFLRSHGVVFHCEISDLDPRCRVSSSRACISLSCQAVVTIVVSAIQVFSNIAAIVNRGCLVLHNIALDPGHFSALVAMGAPAKLVQAVGKHPSDPLLRQCATGTLRRLHMGGLLSSSLNGAAVGASPAPQVV